MNQLVTTAIILHRTDYGEADRILSLLTPEYGKLALIAKGVRRVKSKLAGGIELFSVSEITFIKGRGEVGTLVSTRLVKHYEHIVTNLDRTMLGYELIKRLNKVTEDQLESEYFTLLRDTFEALDDNAMNLDLVRFWFNGQLLRLSGHTPNLQSDQQGNKLLADMRYEFDFEHMTFIESPVRGQFNASHIKFLRLVLAGNSMHVLSSVQGSSKLVQAVQPMIQHLTQLAY